MKDYFAEQGMPEALEPACAVVKNLVGQKAIVTGANSGIGRAVAIALGHAGADVVVNYVSREDEAAKVVDEIRWYTEGCAVRGADPGRLGSGHEREPERPVPLLARGGPRLQAPGCSPGNLARRRQDPVHQLGARHHSLGGARQLRRVQGGVMMMMKSIAQEVAPDKIRVNSISPGAVRTPINTSAWNTAQAYNALMALIPYKRIGEPAELGRAAVWLASDDSDYITGATIYVDGGMTLYPGFETGG
jgi:glucose 1-dehydrogenase